jgi:hypothetical protein
MGTALFLSHVNLFDGLVEHNIILTLTLTSYLWQNTT